MSLIESDLATLFLIGVGEFPESYWDIPVDHAYNKDLQKPFDPPKSPHFKFIRFMNISSSSMILGREALLKAGYLTITGDFTEKGRLFFLKMKARYDTLSSGIPIDKRKKKRYSILSTYTWGSFSLTLRLQQAGPKVLHKSRKSLVLVTPSEKPYLILSQPFYKKTPKNLQELPDDIVSFYTSYIKSATDKKTKRHWVKVDPFAFQCVVPTGHELIWMRTKDKSREVAMQSQFYDYLRKKHPKGWFLTRKGPMKGFNHIPIIMEVPSVKMAGFRENIVAIVARVEVTNADLWPVLKVQDE